MIFSHCVSAQRVNFFSIHASSVPLHSAGGCRRCAFAAEISRILQSATFHTAKSARVHIHTHFLAPAILPSYVASPLARMNNYLHDGFELHSGGILKTCISHQKQQWGPFIRHTARRVLPREQFGLWDTAILVRNVLRILFLFE